MGISIRYSIVQDDGAVRRVPQRVSEGLSFGKDAVPEYAGTKQKVAQVVVESDRGKPVRICDIRGHYWTFDDAGHIHDALQEGLAEYLNACHDAEPKRDGRVVDLVPEIKKKELRAKREWAVSQDAIDKIASDLWPGVHGPVREITTVNGKAPRRPPLSWQARGRALRDRKTDRNGKAPDLDAERACAQRPRIRGAPYRGVRRAGSMEQSG